MMVDSNTQVFYKISCSKHLIAISTITNMLILPVFTWIISLVVILFVIRHWKQNAESLDI